MDSLYLQKQEFRADNQKLRLVLIAERADFSVPRKIINVFYCVSEQQSTELLEKLVFAGYELDASYLTPVSGTTDPWVLEVGKLIVPNIMELNLMTDECVEMAVQLGVTYDGWFTAVEPRLPSQGSL